METFFIAQATDQTPFLEHYPEDGGPPVRTALDSLPLTIGRDSSADLQIKSGRVSRRHAMISREGGTYHVEDLGSTNGTFLNGERVSEATLQSGDILALGDVELTFVAGRQESATRMATQPMGPGHPDAAEGAPLHLICQVRRMQETLLSRGNRVEFQSILRLDSGEVFGHEALDADVGRRGTPMAEQERLLMRIECRLTTRIRQVRRLIAVEDAEKLAEGSHVMLKVGSSEIGADWLIDSLVELKQTVPSGKRLIIAVPHETVSESTFFREFHGRLRESGIGVAYDDFAGPRLPVTGVEQMLPDFLKLSRSLIRGIHRTPQTQHHVEELVRDAQSIGCRLIATAIRSEEEAACCRQLGCELGQGRLFGETRLPPGTVDFAMANYV